MYISSIKKAGFLKTKNESHYLLACFETRVQSIYSFYHLISTCCKGWTIGFAQHMSTHHITTIIIPWLEQSLDKLFLIAFLKPQVGDVNFEFEFE